LALNNGGIVKNAVTGKIFAALAVLGAGLAVAGCKSTPALSADDAQKLIQAKYDQTPPSGALIRVDDLGMQQGVTAKYWDRSKAFPVKWWADFKLTPDGKKVVTLANGGDTIEWRPASSDDKNFAVIMTTVVANHRKAREVKDPQDQGDGTKTVEFNEAVDLSGVPAPLQDIAHDPGNKLSTHRTATFALENGAWTLQSIS
jgi:hypothetical protein